MSGDEAQLRALRTPAGAKQLEREPEGLGVILASCRISPLQRSLDGLEFSGPAGLAPSLDLATVPAVKDAFDENERLL
jgi:hypothetical protein